MIYGEKNTVNLVMKNTGALPVQAYIWTPDEREFQSYTLTELEEKREEEKQAKIKDEVMTVRWIANEVRDEEAKIR